jgi:DHA1 family tetracycline resistance protein-like MFS transporter
MRRSPLAILFVTVFLDLLGFGIVIPFLAYYVESFGAGAGVVGALMSMFSLAQFIFAPLWGSASDRVGRRPILLIGLAGSVLGYAMFGFAASLAWLFAARILAGIAGATIPTAQAYIADSTTPENRAKGMGMIGAAFGLGFILGPALGGLLARVALPLANTLGQGGFANLLRGNPYALPSFAAAALAAVNLVAAIFLLPESLSPELRQRAIANRIGRLEGSMWRGLRSS